jgi:transposase
MAIAITTPLILAIDLGKFNSVFCWYDPIPKATSFRTVPTDPEKIRAALLRHPNVTVVMEACSPAGWVSDLCRELGLPVIVASTNGDAWAWKNVKRKTDRDDALKLARLASVGELQPVPVPPKPARQRKSLIGLRKRLVSERIRGQNRIRGLLVGQGLPAPRGAKAWTEFGLAGLAERARPLAECGDDELWRGELYLLLARYRSTVEQIAEIERKLDALGAKDEATVLLETAPGVGPRTAEVIASYLGDAKRFRNGDEVSAYAGLVPRQYQSGETDRRGRITKRGPKLLRSAMVECAWCSLRYNAWARGVWQRLLANGLSKKKAVVALARKLLVRCWGMLKRGEPWRDPTAALAATPVNS